ncbi:hypothetical protein Tco_0657275 [Tanacetum coccineum]|uniref:Uncharacterized protein n=1 Tax=Tanacetum coccineum TaxID=301880 RepID=A0ABQ4XCG6_9ASTR
MTSHELSLSMYFGLTCLSDIQTLMMTGLKELSEPDTGGKVISPILLIASSVDFLFEEPVGCIPHKGDMQRPLRRRDYYLGYEKDNSKVGYRLLGIKGGALCERYVPLGGRFPPRLVEGRFPPCPKVKVDCRGFPFSFLPSSPIQYGDLHYESAFYSALVGIRGPRSLLRQRIGLGLAEVDARLASGILLGDLVVNVEAVMGGNSPMFGPVKYYLCTSFIERHTAKGVGLRVADSYTGNHHEKDFTPLETIQRFLSVMGVDPFRARRGGLQAESGGKSSEAFLVAEAKHCPENRWQRSGNVGRDPEGDHPTRESETRRTLRKHVDAFAWTRADMTRIPCFVTEHQLKTYPYVEPIVQKKRSLAPDRRKVFKEVVAEWLNVGIVKCIQYPNWAANPMLVKKADDSWRMCIDFKDLNKAYPKRLVPLA